MADSERDADSPMSDVDSYGVGGTIKTGTTFFENLVARGDESSAGRVGEGGSCCCPVGRMGGWTLFCWGGGSLSVGQGLDVVLVGWEMGLVPKKVVERFEQMRRRSFLRNGARGAA